jgi:phosphatidate cytidylyltransferase
MSSRHALPAPGFSFPAVTTIFRRDGLLLRRGLPALVLAPLLLWAATQAVVPTYVAAVSVFALVGAAELYRLLARAGYRPLWPLGLALTFALAVVPATAPGYLVHVQAALVGASLAWVAFRRVPGHGLVDWALTLVPALYVGGLLGYYPLLRELPDGPFWVQTVLGCTWAADIAAFAIGRRWGRTRLAPTLSPGKSVEGAIAGGAAAVLLAMVLAVALPAPGRSVPVLMGLGLLVAVAGLIGDLAESFVKRQLGAKDSSGLLLGHGGLLDRLDSLLGAGMVAYFYLVAVGG